MGKALIIENLENAQYKVKLLMNEKYIQDIVDNLKKQIDKLKIKIEELKEKIAEEEDEEEKKRLQLELTSLQLKLTALELAHEKYSKHLNADLERIIYCADFSDELTGEVGTIEMVGDVPKETKEGDDEEEGDDDDEKEEEGEGRGVQIQPGYEDNATFDSKRDGQLAKTIGLSVASDFFNLAILPGWQKWMSRYRYATITKLDSVENLCDIELETCTTIIIKGIFWKLGISYAESNKCNNGEKIYKCIENHISDSDKEPGVGIDWTTYWDPIGKKEETEFDLNHKTDFKDVSIEYMNTDSESFKVEDIVLLRFDKPEDPEDELIPKIIGFKKPRRTIPWMVLKVELDEDLRDPPLTNNDYVLVWDPVTNAKSTTIPKNVDDLTAWTTGIAYEIDDEHKNNASAYKCILGHTSSADDEPGIGKDWTTYWTFGVFAIFPCKLSFISAWIETTKNIGKPLWNAVKKGFDNADYNILTAWTTGTAYEIDDMRKNELEKEDPEDPEGPPLKYWVAYRCIRTHTSSDDKEPGIGGNWAAYWILAGWEDFECQPDMNQSCEKITEHDNDCKGLEGELLKDSINYWKTRVLLGRGIRYDETIRHIENVKAYLPASEEKYNFNSVEMEKGTSYNGLTAWVIDDYYTIGEKRNNGTAAYTCILNHTSSADDEPGVGGNWTTYWTFGGGAFSSSAILSLNRTYLKYYTITFVYAWWYFFDIRKYIIKTPLDDFEEIETIAHVYHFLPEDPEDDERIEVKKKIYFDSLHADLMGKYSKLFFCQIYWMQYAITEEILQDDGSTEKTEKDRVVKVMIQTKIAGPKDPEDPESETETFPDDLPALKNSLGRNASLETAITNLVNEWYEQNGYEIKDIVDCKLSCELLV